MAIALGSTTSDAPLLFFQICFLQSFFWVSLGMCLYCEDTLAPKATFSPRSGQGLTLSALFGQLPTQSLGPIITCFGLHGIIFGFVVGVITDRRGVCQDACVTSFSLQLLFCWAVVGWPRAWIFWIGFFLDLFVALAVSKTVSGRREMAEIAVPNSDQHPSKSIV